MTPRPRVARSAIVAAVVMSLVVLGLFLRLQEYGPESAIRKFHQAVAKRSLGDLRRVTVEDVRTPEVDQLVRMVESLMANGGNRPRMLRADRTPTEVRAAVAYSIPPNRSIYMVWVVKRIGRTWRVSADGTVQLLRQAQPFQ